jgi:KUP system potassium uptake protein
VIVSVKYVALVMRADNDGESPSYFVSRTGIRVTAEPGVRRWRKRLFVVLARNAASPIECFGLPPERTISMSAELPL